MHFAINFWNSGTTCLLNKLLKRCDNSLYYIPINDMTLELSVFWPSDTESRINKLRFSESMSLFFKTKLMSVTCF